MFDRPEALPWLADLNASHQPRPASSGSGWAAIVAPCGRSLPRACRRRATHEATRGEGIDELVHRSVHDLLGEEATDDGGKGDAGTLRLHCSPGHR
jgi:hypothetical protein